MMNLQIQTDGCCTRNQLKVRVLFFLSQDRRAHALSSIHRNLGGTIDSLAHCLENYRRQRLVEFQTEGRKRFWFILPEGEQRLKYLTSIGVRP